MQYTHKTNIIYLVIFVLILTAVFGVYTDNSYAAQSFEVTQGTRWVQGENINSGLRIKTSDGRIAYCLNQGKASPMGSYTSSYNLSSKLKAVLYYGYPNSRKFGSTSLTGDQARCATQLAVWAHDNSNKGNKIDLSKLHGASSEGTAGDNVLKAAKWLYSKANGGYTAPSKPDLSTPSLSQPSDKTPVFFNSSYVRVGPYKLTTNTGNHTSSHKVTIDLKQAPSGSYMGDGNGKSISTPAAGSNFYIYLPSASLSARGTSLFKLTASYDYKYEKAATFEAYQKSSTQNVAIGAELNYTEGNKKLDATAEFRWTIMKLTKQDEDDADKVIPQTEFDVYFDPTPENPNNDDWKFMYTKITDSNGVISVPGLGIGTYMLKETKSNPNYALNSEFGKEDKIIFKITNINTDSVQVMKNKAINISCEVDKDTIKKTSAAYRSLPDQEEIDNVGSETYRYHVDYRSTSNTWADEFVVDDPLEGVAEDQIRVTELWTPISHGDFDEMMNIWYKTNKTDDSTDYSSASAVSTNPYSANNLNKDTVKKNTGYKLWMAKVDTTKRTNLKVSDLNLDNDEYITALRLEHGRVERGFTTKNYMTESMNNDEVVDWTPQVSDPFFTEAARDAVGLKPLTYLVMCPNPLSPPEVIKNSADAFIARNIHLTDDDRDEVFTEVIDTFKEDGDRENSVLGEEAKETDDKAVKGEAVEPKTDDILPMNVLIILLVVAGAFAISLLIKLIRGRKASSTKFLSVILTALLLAGTFGYVISDTAVDASTKQVKVASDDSKTGAATAPDLKIAGNFVKNNMTYSLLGTSDLRTQDGHTSCKVSYKMDEKIDADLLDRQGSSKLIPKSITVSTNDYKGILTAEKRRITPLYIKVKTQVDRTEIIENLDAEDIIDLPQSKVYTVRSDSSVNATVDKELKRAGVKLKVVGYDSEGVPDKWNATLVYRGTENYLEKNEYSVEAEYSGRVASVNSTKPTENDNLHYEEAIEKYQDEFVEGIYDEGLGLERIETPEPAKADGRGFTTTDLIKGLLVFMALAVVGFLGFIKYHRKKENMTL